MGTRYHDCCYGNGYNILFKWFLGVKFLHWHMPIYYIVVHGSQVSTLTYAYIIYSGIGQCFHSCRLLSFGASLNGRLIKPIVTNNRKMWITSLMGGHQYWRWGGGGVGLILETIWINAIIVVWTDIIWKNIMLCRCQNLLTSLNKFQTCEYYKTSLHRKRECCSNMHCVHSKREISKKITKLHV